MKKTTLTLLAAAALALSPAISAGGQQVTRSAGPQAEAQTAASTDGHHYLRLSDKRVSRHASAVTPSSPLKTLNAPGHHPAPKGISLGEDGKAQMKAASNATEIYGFRYWSEEVYRERGWAKITPPTVSILWKSLTSFDDIPRYFEYRMGQCGFVRDGNVYSFYNFTNDGALLNNGVIISDFNTGETLGYNKFDVFEDNARRKVVYEAVYDETNDEVYVVTPGTRGYSLQKFDPNTFEFTDLGVEVSSDWVAFGWHPGEHALYMIDESGGVNKYDSTAKKFVKTASYSYTLLPESAGVMTFSPNDDAFYAIVDSYTVNDTTGSESYKSDVILISTAGKVTYVNTLESYDGFGFIYCPDPYSDPTAPAAPTVTFNVSGAATSGSLTVTLPNKLGNGTALTGTVYLQVKLDGTDITPTGASGAAGTTVNVPFTSTEGMHRFLVTAYVLGDSEKLYGRPAIINKYLGNDVPAAPTDVKLTGTTVTWTAVSAGANGGYINTAGLTYDVYVDGEKMNKSAITGTSYNFTAFPANGAVAHRASVVAVVDGKESAAGVSDKAYDYTPSKGLNLPVTLATDPGQVWMDEEMIKMFTIKKDPLNTDSYRGWRYDDQGVRDNDNQQILESTGGFYCLYPKEGQSTNPTQSDEWLFLPVINFDDASKYYRLLMDVWTADHPFTKDEVYEVALVQDPGRVLNPTIIRQATTVTKKPDFETSETLFQVPSAGKWYIGVHYITDPSMSPYRLYARNFRVAMTNSTAKSPGAVTDLEAEASPKGALSAVVTFKMPTVNISGAALASTAKITAKVSTGAGEVSTTGTPGQSCSVTVPASQGINVVQVFTSSETDGEGMLSEITVYCGVYTPSAPIIDYEISEDNATLTLTAELDDYNDNGEWAGAADCDVKVYRRVGSTWREVQDLGSRRTYTFSVKPTDPLDSYEFGMGASNAAGQSEIASIAQVLGKPCTLPMSDDFTSNDLKYDMFIEHLSYLPGTWGFNDPAEYDELAKNESGTALIATWESITQVRLSKFSTKGYVNVWADFDIFFGDKMPKSITVYGNTLGVQMEELAQFTRQDGNGWEHKWIYLPMEFQNQGWVELIIRVELEGYSSYFMMDSYSIQNIDSDMITITSMKGDNRGVVGEKSTFSVELVNASGEAADVPAYTMTLVGDKGVIGNLQAVNAPKKLPASSATTLNFEFTPKAADKGDIVARFDIGEQPEPAVTKAEWQIKVVNAALPVVDDLSPWMSDDRKDVVLLWSDAVYTESFEGAQTWSYANTIREFTNIDNDKSKVWGITEVAYPGKGVAKGFQVFSSVNFSNYEALRSHTGEQALLAMSTSSGETDDWLISPEVKGGTTVSFWMNVLDAQYPETINFMVSKTGNSINDFESVTGGYICPDKEGWQQYTFRLPADAKYFALWHNGDNGAEQFGCMIDDIKYDAANPKFVKESYNVYRDGKLVGNVTEPGFTETYTVTEPISYYVTTVGKVNGETVESDPSKTVWVTTETSGVEDIAADASAGSICAAAGKIVFTGFEDGMQAQVYTTDGALTGTAKVSGTGATVAVAPGLYIARCGEKVAKVAVR